MGHDRKIMERRHKKVRGYRNRDGEAQNYKPTPPKPPITLPKVSILSSETEAGE